MKLRSVLVLAAGAGAGYLLGTRQGRVKLAQLKSQAATVAHDPGSSRGVSSVAEQVEKQAHYLPQPAQGIVRAAAEQVQSTVDKAQSDPTGPTVPPASLIMKWTAADLGSQAGRTVIVTGANSGLGKATTKAFAAAGARVVMAVRDLTRGQQALDELTPLVDGPLELRRLDLADLASVRAFAAGWDETVDVLVNNAGIMAVAEGTTADAFETQFGTNHLGHFALTNLLLPHVGDRVVTVSSGAHRMGTIDLDDLNWQRRAYSPWRAYGQSKLANLLFTLELQRRLSAQGSTVRALAAHPGYAATNLQTGTSNKWADRAMAVANKVIAQSDEMGALPTLFAASQDLPGASYVGPDGMREGRGYPTLVGRTSDASDVVLAGQLWAKSAELTGIDFPADAGDAT